MDGLGVLLDNIKDPVFKVKVASYLRNNPDVLRNVMADKHYPGLSSVGGANENPLLKIPNKSIPAVYDPNDVNVLRNELIPHRYQNAPPVGDALKARQAPFSGSAPNPNLPAVYDPDDVYAKNWNSPLNIKDPASKKTWWDKYRWNQEAAKQKPFRFTEKMSKGSGTPDNPVSGRLARIKDAREVPRLTEASANLLHGGMGVVLKLIELEQKKKNEFQENLKESQYRGKNWELRNENNLLRGNPTGSILTAKKPGESSPFVLNIDLKKGLLDQLDDAKNIRDMEKIHGKNLRIVPSDFFKKRKNAEKPASSNVTVGRSFTGAGRKNAKPFVMKSKSTGSGDAEYRKWISGGRGGEKDFWGSVPVAGFGSGKAARRDFVSPLASGGGSAGSGGLAGAAKEAGVVDDNSAWETFRKIRDSVNEVPYPQYRGLKNIEKHNAVGDTQNLLILNREAQEERELVAKQWEWKRKYGSQRDMLKRELMGKLLGVPPDMLAPEPYPVGKKDKKGKSQRDVSWARAGQMGEAGFKADTLDAAESGRRMTTAGTLTDHEMGRKAELQNRKAQIDADKDIKTLNSGYNLEGKKYQVDAEKEKYVAGYMMKIASERNDKVKDYMSRYDRMTPADQAKIGDGRSWAAEMADQDITRAYGTTLKMLERMQ